MSKTPEILCSATRQYKHNNEDESFVIAFEQEETIKIVERLQDRIAHLERLVIAAELEKLLIACKGIGMGNSECTCVDCPLCKGSGQVRSSSNDDYLGTGRCDDMDELECCAYCHGSGIDDYCDYCFEQEELHEQEEFEKINEVR